MFRYGNYEFFQYKKRNFEVYFSTSKANLDFNLQGNNSEKSMELIKSIFNLTDVGYLRQIHSDIVKIYPEKAVEGDALINTEKNIAIGVFTADCVPVILIDIEKGITATIHCGWKGIYKDIIRKTFNMMKTNLKSDVKHLYAFIGPHISQCCYNINDDLAQKFMDKDVFSKQGIIKNNFLDLNQCVKLQLKEIGINESNIQSVDVCTSCDRRYDLYSYRKSGGICGRMFSFAIIR